MSDPQLCFLTASDLVQKIKAREISAVEVLQAHLEQIERVNPHVNAIVTLLPDRAEQAAQAIDEQLGRGEDPGPLCGLPVAHKDLVVTKGIRTTFGSPIYQDFIPDEDALIVERLRDAGAVTIGKTNTPEFGAGSQTFNEVFGETHNPYDLTKTCGGSSGGAAVSLACGMLPIADGSDTGGSLRNPAAFCNVVGFRPSPGRVPVWPNELGWFPISVQGPMARTVEDVALMLSAIAGPDPRDPIAIPAAGDRFRQPLARDFRNTRIAWSADFGGLPMDRQITQVLEPQIETFEGLGCQVAPGQPDFSDADEIFQVLRAWAFELKFTPLIEKHREQIKDTIIWNAEFGQSLTGPQISRAENLRTQLFQRVVKFMETHEFMIFPVTQVPPFDLQQPYIEEIDGVKMQTYIDWMKSCYFVTVTGLPAISVPCGFTETGLPVGLQIVGRHQDDWGVLQLAYAFQQATQFGTQRPQIAVTA
ncbi:MAG: amidase [Planctomycetota bacterium]|nr:amidase [Planctomycetota bacterium]